MSNLQLYLTIGIPTLAVLISTSIQVPLYLSLGKHMDRFERRMDRFQEPHGPF